MARGLPMVLISLDGWGHSPRREGNAVANCGAVNMESLAARHPNTLLEASGLSVGVPAGQMGNSEVGHMCMGAGRVVLQDLMRITRAIQTGAMLSNPVLCRVMDQVASRGSALHLMGLASDGGVHSHLDHAMGLVAMAKARGLHNVHFHAFLDGRDTAPRCALRYIESLERFFAAQGVGRFATIVGRYYAMDRDNRWERTELAYRAMTGTTSMTGMTGGAPDALFVAQDAASGLRAAYARDEGDEFVKPTAIAPTAPGGEKTAVVRGSDAVIFFNFRADRARQITRAFAQKDFDRFPRGAGLEPGAFVCMTRYDETFDLPIAFPPDPPEHVVGQVISEAGLRQVRIAETEKYAHVTFFFNGGEERTFPGEERILIPSPQVATYDKAPEMSAGPITDVLLERLRKGASDLVMILNFANADMVGHTGDYEATLRACRFVDQCVGRIVREVGAMGGSVVITADHGNAEQMIDPETGGPQTAHTLNPVPVIVVSSRMTPSKEGLRPGGTLADVGPTMLQLLDLPQPAEMTGRSLLR